MIGKPPTQIVPSCFSYMPSQGRSWSQLLRRSRQRPTRSFQRLSARRSCWRQGTGNACSVALPTPYLALHVSSVGRHGSPAPRLGPRPQPGTPSAQPGTTLHPPPPPSPPPPAPGRSLRLNLRHPEHPPSSPDPGGPALLHLLRCSASTHSGTLALWSNARHLLLLLLLPSSRGYGRQP